MNEKLAWYVARSAGIVGWLLLTAAVLWGLLLASGLLRRPKRGWYLDLHRFLGGLTVTFAAVHIAALYLDSFVQFGVADLFVPFASRWRPVPVAYGITATYLLIAVEGTSLALPRVPRRVWRWVHLSSFVLWALVTLHMLTAGTDTGWLRWAAAGSVALVVAFAIARMLVVIPEPTPPERPARRQPVSPGPGSPAAQAAPELS